METNLHEEAVADVLHTVLSESDSELMFVSQAPETIEEMVSVLGALDSPPSVRLYAPAAVLKTVMSDFLVAGSTADLVDAGVLSIRTGRAPDGTLVIGDSYVASLVSAGDRVAWLVTTDGPFVDSTADGYADRWADGEEYRLRTPPISRIRSSLESEMNEAVADDFNAVMESLGTVRGDSPLDEVSVSLLVAAKNHELLYDISKWGEDVGIASKATFSRTKTKLEDQGLIDTEKVPIDVGRPRLRLLLGDDRLEDADASQLASVAQSVTA